MLHMLFFLSGFGINLRGKKTVLLEVELPLLKGHLLFDKQTQKQPLAHWIQPRTCRCNVLVYDHNKGRSYQDCKPCQVGKSLQEGDRAGVPLFPKSHTFTC